MSYLLTLDYASQQVDGLQFLVWHVDRLLALKPALHGRVRLLLKGVAVAVIGRAMDLYLGFFLCSNRLQRHLALSSNVVF